MLTRFIVFGILVFVAANETQLTSKKKVFKKVFDSNVKTCYINKAAPERRSDKDLLRDKGIATQMMSSRK